MSVEHDYLALREVQKLARAEMWHVFSHHPDIEDEWNKTAAGWGPCWAALKGLIDWEPDEG